MGMSEHPMLELMSDARRAEIRERIGSATPGPWESRVLGNTVRSRAVVMHGVYSRADVNICSGISLLTSNAAFIAHARTDLPELYAENSALRAELERVTRELEDAEDDLERAGLCENCKYSDNDECGETCGDSDSLYRWQWRGLPTPTYHAKGAEGGGEG